MQVLMVLSHEWFLWSWVHVPCLANRVGGLVCISLVCMNACGYCLSLFEWFLWLCKHGGPAIVPTPITCQPSSLQATTHVASVLIMYDAIYAKCSSARQAIHVVQTTSDAR